MRELLGDQSNIKGQVNSRVKTLPLTSRSLKLIWPLSQPDSGRGDMKIRTDAEIYAEIDREDEPISRRVIRG
jgi:hypothetical protein